MKHLRKFHTELWDKLRNLENQSDTIAKIYNPLKRISLQELEEKFYWEDAQMTIFDFIESEE